MPETIERTPLETILAQACQFAIAHGVEGPISPDDFGIQRSSKGYQHATYVDASHVVSLTIDPHGEAILRVAELDWIHDQGDDGRDPCRHCECLDCGAPISDCECPPLALNVPLPGDGTPPPTPEIPPYAVRDEHGAIRRARDGLYIIAGHHATAAGIQAHLEAYDGNDSAYAHSMRRLYTGALELITAEAAGAPAEAVSVDA